MPRMLRGSRLLRGGLAMDLALLAVFLVLAYVFLVRRNYTSQLDSAVNVSGGRSLDTSDGQVNPKFPHGGGAPANDETPSADGDSQHLIDARIKKMPDPRPLECKSLNYNAKTRVSVVVKFFDYEFFDLKMTLSSVLLNTEADKLQEIIVVDDGSTLDYIVSSAQTYLKSIAKCRFLRNDVKVGVAGARMRGYREAAADVVVFLDTTVLVSRGWLEPLVDAIAKKPKSIAVPHYDRINNPVDYEYESTADNLVASMTWSLTVRMTEATDKAEVTQSIKSPMLRGNAFAVRKAYLGEVGGYDEGLNDGGGENLELALRTWMCGGTIQIVPCSRVGVLNLHDPVRIIAAGNFRRVAELWLGQSKSLAYRNAGVASKLSESEQSALETRRESVKERLTCQGIDWFFANVAGNLPTPSAKAQNFGLMKCRTGRCARVETDSRIELGACNPDNINVPPAEMFFEFDEEGHLTSSGKCLTVKSTAYVLAEDCRPGEVEQRWEYKENRMVNQWSHYCLMHVTDPDKETGGKRQIAMAQDCATASDPQFVEFDFITL